MDVNIRLSQPALKILRAFLNAHEASVRARLAGADVMREARIASGTMYPILLRLEDAGVLESEWETEAPQDLGRPRRRLYRLTGAGAHFARRSFAEFLPLSMMAMKGRA